MNPCIKTSSLAKVNLEYLPFLSPSKLKKLSKIALTKISMTNAEEYLLGNQRVDWYHRWRVHFEFKNTLEFHELKVFILSFIYCQKINKIWISTNPIEYHLHNFDCETRIYVAIKKIKCIFHIQVLVFCTQKIALDPLFFFWSFVFFCI